MAFESDRDAQEALLASIEAQVAPEPVAPVEQADPPPTAPPVEAETTPTAEPVEDFRGFDESVLATLPENVQAQVRAERDSMRADYTRKTQAAAELRKQFDGLDPDLARQSVQYINSLSDPTFLVQAREAMDAELERLGLLNPAPATPQIPEQEYDEDDGVVPPQVMNTLNELQAWKQQQEQRNREQDTRDYQAGLAAEAKRQENILREQHPDYKDTDLARVYGLAWNHGGNLIEANKEYQGIKADILRDYLAEKTGIPGSIAPPPIGGGGATPPVKPRTMDEAHAIALERIKHLED